MGAVGKDQMTRMGSSSQNSKGRLQGQLHNILGNYLIQFFFLNLKVICNHEGARAAQNSNGLDTCPVPRSLLARQKTESNFDGRLSWEFSVAFCSHFKGESAQQRDTYRDTACSTCQKHAQESPR